VEGLTPAFADDLPPLGELIADDSFWRYPAGLAREGVAHLRVWTTATVPPGHLAVVTETGGGASVTEFAGLIWAVLAGRFGPSLVLLEHNPAPEVGHLREAGMPLTGDSSPRSRVSCRPGRRTPAER
jgi:hypothetical protein